MLQPRTAPTERSRPVSWRPKLFSGFALGVVCTLVGSSSASALGLNTYPDEPTEAEASIAGLELGGEDLLALAQSDAGSVTNPGPNREPFSGDIAGGEVVDFGNGVTIPLDQLISSSARSASSRASPPPPTARTARPSPASPAPTAA